MSWILTGILSIICIFLLIKKTQKYIVDKTELIKYENDIERLKVQKEDLRLDIQIQQETIDDYNKKISIVQKEYKEELSKKNRDLTTYFNKLKDERESELNHLFKEKQEKLELKYKNAAESCDKAIRIAEMDAEQAIAAADLKAEQVKSQTNFEEHRYEMLLAPLKQYEMEKQQRLFYTIQVPDGYKEDIDFLLNTVSQKVRHPDIINKLIWAEYVKPYIEETFKRIEIKPEPGIYKLTNIESGKSYIGKSTDVKKRIADHFKSSVGISNIADQAVHHAILETGLWNWTIEIIIYCDKEQLNELEKYYINFFKSQEYGYNKTGGG